MISLVHPCRVSAALKQLKTYAEPPQQGAAFPPAAHPPLAVRLTKDAVERVEVATVCVTECVEIVEVDVLVTVLVTGWADIAVNATKATKTSTMAKKAKVVSPIAVL